MIRGEVVQSQALERKRLYGELVSTCKTEEGLVHSFRNGASVEVTAIYK